MPVEGRGRLYWKRMEVAILNLVSHLFIDARSIDAIAVILFTNNPRVYI